MLIVICVSVIALGVVCIKFLNLGGGINGFLKEVDAGNYTKAQSVYYSSILGNTEKELQVSQALHSRLNDAVEDYNNDRISLDEAISVITTISRLDVIPFYEVDNISEQLNNLNTSKLSFESAERLYEEGYYFDAYNCYQSVIEEDSLYYSAQEKARLSLNLVLDNVDEQLEILIAANDYAGALDLIDNTVLLTGESATLSSKRTEYSAKYLSYALSEAEGALTSIGYEQSISIIASAIDRIGDDPRLVKALEYYELFKPLYINEMDYYGKSEWGSIHAYSDAKDNLGNEYKYGFFISNADGTGGEDMYVTFYLGGNYSVFTGTCILPYDLRSEKDGNCFKIFGDDVLLFTSNTMTEGSSPQEFSLDVEDVVYLKIVYPYKTKTGISRYIANETATLCDGLLTKNIQT